MKADSPLPAEPRPDVSTPGLFREAARWASLAASKVEHGSPEEALRAARAAQRLLGEPLARLEAAREAREEEVRQSKRRL